MATTGGDSWTETECTLPGGVCLEGVPEGGGPLSEREGGAPGLGKLCAETLIGEPCTDTLALSCVRNKMEI